MALAMEREHIVHSSLLMVAGTVLADLGPMLARLVRGCIDMAFTACVLAVACSHCLADTVKVGCELICMALAMEREPTGCSSLLMVLRTAVAGLDPMLVRLVCGCIALAVTVLVLAVVCRHRLVDTVKVGCELMAAWHWR